MSSTILLSVVLPCLNEADTIGTCITKIAATLKAEKITGEIIVADNNSTDTSVEIAKRHGARVVHVAERGYGYTLQKGIAAAHGIFIIMGDCDESYDFSHIPLFLTALENGAHMVIGNRFLGGIAAGAMPLSHRIGVRVLTEFGRILIPANVHDFHCGLRGMRSASFRTLPLRCGGMDFATEMILCATTAGQRLVEVPTTLSLDRRISHGSHLRTMRDGWQALRTTIRCWIDAKRLPTAQLPA